jgi:hypothetical protein
MICTFLEVAKKAISLGFYSHPTTNSVLRQHVPRFTIFVK